MPLGLLLRPRTLHAMLTRGERPPTELRHEPGEILDAVVDEERPAEVAGGDPQPRGQRRLRVRSGTEVVAGASPALDAFGRHVGGDGIRPREPVDAPGVQEPPQARDAYLPGRRVRLAADRAGDGGGGG